jgi:3-hydroxybutyryl-CoA dehydratase
MTADHTERTSRSSRDGSAMRTTPASAFELDFDELSTGLELTTRGRTITESDVVAFAAQTGDWHAQHTDAEFARESHFGERIAHGMLVLSYALGLLPIDPHRVVALRRVADATFKAPVHIGDTIRVRAEVAEVKPLDERFGLVGFRWRILNQRGATVVRARVEVLWRRRNSPALAERRGADPVGLVCLPL